MLSSTSTKPIRTRSAADVLGSARPKSLLQRMQLLVMQAPDNGAMPIIAVAPFDFAN